MSQRSTPSAPSGSEMTLLGAFAIIVIFFLMRLATNWADSTTTAVYLGASVVLALVVLYAYNRPARVSTDIPEPAFSRYLFSSTESSWLWLIARLYLGTEWLGAGVHKVLDPAWMQDGTALQGFFQRIVAIPETGKPPITFDWYRPFIQSFLDSGNYVWFAKIIAVGEVLVGIALIVGLFVGIAAFFGALMNFNFMLAGSASTNPLLFLVAILLILAWKVAGYIGIDGLLLPTLGTPWAPGTAFKHSDSP